MHARCKQEGVFRDRLKAVFKETSFCSAHGHEIRKEGPPLSGKKKATSNCT